MSLPDEKARSLIMTQEFMRRLLSPYDGGYKRVPREVKIAARACLKHYPSLADFAASIKKSNIIDQKVFKEALANWFLEWERIGKRRS